MSNCGDRISTARGLLESIQRTHDDEIRELKSTLEEVYKAWLSDCNPQELAILCENVRKLIAI